MKRLFVRLFTWSVGGLLVFVAVVALQEIVMFALSDEADALKRARYEFEIVCAREGLSPNEFGDPKRVLRKDKVYEFHWKNPSNGDEIIAGTSYLPVHAEAWLWRGDDLRAIKQRFKLQ